MGIFDRFKKYIATDAEKLRDPVCGMTVAKNETLKTVFKDKVYYFCSLGCKEKFDQDQEKFIKNR